jgi:hypothetical protein
VPANFKGDLDLSMLEDLGFLAGVGHRSVTVHSATDLQRPRLGWTRTHSLGSPPPRGEGMWTTQLPASRAQTCFVKHAGNGGPAPPPCVRTPALGLGPPL